MFDNLEQAIEKKRLEALKKYDVLDTGAEQIYDDLTKLASHICDMPISLVSLVDHHRQWFKSKVGIDATETSRDIAFCAHAIKQDDLFVVKDATKDPRFSKNPLVTSAPNIRFYAGAPLKTPNGSKVGTLCVIDKEPRDLTSEQEEALTILARQVVENFEIRLANRMLEKEAELIQELLETCESKDNILYTLTHDLKGSLSSIVGLSELLMENIPEGSDGDVFKMAENVHQSGEASVKLLEAVLQWSINQGKLSSFLPVEMNMNEVIG